MNRRQQKRRYERRVAHNQGNNAATLLLAELQLKAKRAKKSKAKTEEYVQAGMMKAGYIKGSGGRWRKMSAREQKMWA